MNKITDTVYYVGVNDKNIDLFEGQYAVPKGMAYNSYVVLDDKIAVMDTVDKNFTHEWLDNISAALDGRKPDYLVVQHMEPDHSANIKNFMNTYPEAKIVANAKTFSMISQFFGDDFADRQVVVKNCESLDLGERALTFLFAPMVHWPEVMMTYDSKDEILFSADGFGKFGALDADEEWDDEARRYYIGIVGKYGAQVQNVLKKAKDMDIRIICPLHGPVLTENLGHYIGLYDTWSSYAFEDDGVVIAYTSIYGNTKAAAASLADKLKAKGAPQVVLYDLARCDMSVAVADAFRYSKLVLASPTYNAGIFPFMNHFIDALTERNFQNRTVAFIENGTWSPLAAKIMKEKLSACKNLTFAETTVSVRSALNREVEGSLNALADELCKDYVARSSDMANKNDLTALFKIGYGLYVVTCSDGKKDNGLIVNTVAQLTSQPNRVAVTINKANYSHHVISQSKKLNVCCLSTAAPFSIFKNFGFRSGRSCDKFEGISVSRSDNGLYFLNNYINSFMSLEVEQYVEFETHGMFICRITEARVLSDTDTMTYAYYQQNVKPKPATKGKKGYVCKVCGYVYEGDTLPDDFVCPLCKHGAADFEKIQ
ncbi:MAG: flavin reductase [Oscillospiraceae bacterium]|nr:flavin reductase [Oscillospiraceae bacterium]